MVMWKGNESNITKTIIIRKNEKEGQKAKDMVVWKGKKVGSHDTMKSWSSAAKCRANISAETIGDLTWVDTSVALVTGEEIVRWVQSIDGL